MKNILIVTTNTSEINSDIPTGVWYEEFAIPYLEFKNYGYEITVASPNGGKSPIDPKSLKGENQEILSVLDDTHKLINVKAENFDCIFIPGGHGCMFDLPHNSELANIIEYLKSNRKIISAVCHGVCGLISAKDQGAKPYVFGKTLTSFTNEEENLSGLEKYMPFLLETKLKELGAKYINKAPWSSFVVENDYLLTGQNQNSVDELALKIVDKLRIS